MIQLCDKKQRANAFTKGSYLHSLNMIKHSDYTLCLTGKIYESMMKSDTLPPPSRCKYRCRKKKNPKGSR